MNFQTDSKKWGYALSTATLLIVWQGAAWTVDDPHLLPSLVYLVKVSLPSFALLNNPPSEDLHIAVGLIASHIVYTLARVVVGLIVGTTFGMIAGLSIHYFRGSQNVNALLLSIGRAVPLFALIPLFLQWFGGSTVSIYVYIAFGVFVVVSTNAYHAVINIDPVHFQHARLLGANRAQIFRTVHLPATMPEMAGSLRNVAGLCWAFSLGAEYLAAGSGLGYLVYRAYEYADMGKLMILSIIYAALGLFSYLFLQPLIRNIKRWHIGHI